MISRNMKIVYMCEVRNGKSNMMNERLWDARLWGMENEKRSKRDSRIYIIEII